MMSEWQEVALTDIYDVSSGLSKPANSFGSGYPFLSFKEVFGNYFLPDELEQLVESSEKERERCSIKRGDVFLTRTSETMHELGMSSVALKDYPETTFNGFTKRLRPKEYSQYEVHPEFMGYCLRSPSFRTGMLAFSTMSTRASLNNDMISRLVIQLPLIRFQKHIAKVLKSLDDKIELNSQTNQTLEQIAQAIFKSWFVDFESVKAKMAVLEAGGTAEQVEFAAMRVISAKDEAALKQLQADQPEACAELAETAALFPSATEESELGETPEGWRYSEIGDEVTVAGGNTPSTKNSDFWENGSIHWTTPKDLSGLSDKVLLDTDRKISHLGLKKISSGLLPIDTVLMSSRAPVGYLALAKVPVAVSESYIAMKCTKELPPEYVIQWCAHYMDDIKQRAGGTTFAGISKKNFKPLSVVVPSADVLNSYKAKVGGLYDLIANHVVESSSLAKIRDSLLPKLLAGDLPLNGD